MFASNGVIVECFWACLTALFFLADFLADFLGALFAFAFLAEHPGLLPTVQ